MSDEPGANELHPSSEPPPWVMLLSVWQNGSARWHVRLVGADASVRDFDSPFELVRFLMRPSRRGSEVQGGLR